jgi:hypothetical protein
MLSVTVALTERLHAAWLLGLALVRTLARRLLGTSPGYRTFLENYEADNLPPIGGQERKILPLLTGCIGCGLCEFDARGTGINTLISRMALSGARSFPDHALTAQALASVPDHVLAEREALCPTRVPLRTIAGFVRRERGRLQVIE